MTFPVAFWRWSLFLMLWHAWSSETSLVCAAKSPFSGLTKNKRMRTETHQRWEAHGLRNVLWSGVSIGPGNVQQWTLHRTHGKQVHCKGFNTGTRNALHSEPNTEPMAEKCIEVDPTQNPGTCSTLNPTQGPMMWCAAVDSHSAQQSEPKMCSDRVDPTAGPVSENPKLWCQTYILILPNSSVFLAAVFLMCVHLDSHLTAWIWALSSRVCSPANWLLYPRISLFFSCQTHEDKCLIHFGVTCRPIPTIV